MYRSKQVTVIIAAAGSGHRMGSGTESKPFMPLAGVPLLIHTLARFDKAELVDEVVIVCAKHAMEKTEHLVNQYRCRKAVKIVAGGRRKTGQRARGNGCDVHGYGSCHGA